MNGSTVKGEVATKKKSLARIDATPFQPCTFESGNNLKKQCRYSICDMIAKKKSIYKFSNQKRSVSRLHEVSAAT